MTCDECIKPDVRGFFVDMKKITSNTYCPPTNSLIKQIECGLSNPECHDELDCMTACEANPTCQLTTYTEDGVCSLYSQLPVQKCSKAMPMDPKASMKFRQNMTAPVKQEESGRCGCPDSSHKIDPKPGYVAAVICDIAQTRVPPP